jgi:DNA-binding HxlR family transcriptional regulator
MARDTRTYGHFCMLARSLEQLGDRWALLIVRDLLVARRRFTDLIERLGGITPKTLSQRLKALERQGIVQVDRAPGRREVWYELTETGRDLAPVLEELTLWGFRHPQRPRDPGEPLHPEHLLQALRVVLAHSPPLQRPVRWCFDFTDDGTYTLEFDGRQWSLTPSKTTETDVLITSTSDAWADYITTAPRLRATDPAAVDVAGRRPAVDVFRRAIARFPNGADQAR